MSFEKLLKEIEITFQMIYTYQLFVRIAIVLLLFLLIVQAIGFSWWIAVLITFIYAIFAFRKMRKLEPYDEIEKKYPVLHENLRTARDNTDEGNLFVFDLHKNVVGEISKVRVSSFFNVRKARKELMMLSFLAIMVIVLAQYNIKLTNFSVEIGDVSWDIKKIVNFARSSFGGDEIGDGVGESEFTDIFGEKSVAVLGSDKLELELRSSNSEIDINELRPPEKREFISIYPEEIKAVASSSFDEQIPKEQQEIVKNYYNKIAEG